MPVVEDLEQDVEDIGVSLLHLVEQQQRIRVVAHRLGQLSRVLMADVPRGSTDRSRLTVCRS